MVHISNALKDFPRKRTLQLALQLGVKTRILGTLEEDYPTDADKVFIKMLGSWVGNSPKASWEVLEKALAAIDL